MSSLPFRLVGFRIRGGKRGDMTTPLIQSQSADAGHSDAVRWSDIKLHKRIEHGDSTTQQRACACRIYAGWNWRGPNPLTPHARSKRRAARRSFVPSARTCCAAVIDCNLNLVIAKRSGSHEKGCNGFAALSAANACISLMGLRCRPVPEGAGGYILNA